MTFRGFVLLGLHWVQAIDDKYECIKDEDGPKDNPNNLYKCNKGEKCCHEGGLPSCCTEKPTEMAAWEQAQLWGTLAGMIIVLAILVWYCRHDGNCCGNKKGERGGCCNCSEDDSDIEIEKGPEDEEAAVYQEVE